MKHKKINILYMVILLMTCYSCSVTKFIPEDKFLYTGAELELVSEDQIANRSDLKQQLLPLLGPDPNKKFLGSRFGLYFYYKAQQEKPGFINRWLGKKFGEEPVYLSAVDPFSVEELLKNRLENRGYFYSRTEHSVIRNEDKNTARIEYKAVLPQEAYVMEQFQIAKDSLQIYEAIKETLGESLIDPGMPFNLSVFKLERERIDNALKKKGYYNFSSNFLIFEADTNQYDRKKFDLFLRLKKEVPEEAIRPYVIKEVNVYPNYSVELDSTALDTLRFNNRNYIQGKEIFFKPKKLDPFILLDEGQLYDPLESGITSRRLTSLGTYKYVNIRYDVLEEPSTDSIGYLEANIFLSPLTKRAIRVELQALTKSNSFAGPHLAITYSNRNLWSGGELLQITAKAGYETQLSGGSDAGNTSIILGADSDLVFPRMLFPIPINDNWFEYSIPKTRMGAGFEYLNRSNLFSLFSVTGSFGYLWKANRFITHELDPLAVNYVQPGNISPEFQDVLDQNEFLANSFEQQFISGLNYSFVYNEMVDALDIHQFFLNANLDLAGNVLDLMSNGDTPKKFLGLEFAQYAKMDVDFRYHYQLSLENTIATRLFAGIGIPYGNSEVMPFSKQYFAGGPYSIRAFQIRSLGPGTYEPEQENLTYYDQMGNIRLEANVEYRYPIYQFLKGAVFVDAGNVWNTEDNNSLPGGTFGPDFLKEVAVGIGTGLRVDIQNFVIRVDLAAPLHTPWMEKGERWKFRWKDPVLNFAVGYPF